MKITMVCVHVSFEYVTFIHQLYLYFVQHESNQIKLGYTLTAKLYVLHHQRVFDLLNIRVFNFQSHYTVMYTLCF